MTGRCKKCGRGSVTIDNNGFCARCVMGGYGFNPWTDHSPFDDEPVTPPPPPPPPVAKGPTDDEKKLERLKKYLAHAGRREGNENEARAFALRIFKMLEAEALPLRYLVNKGSEVRVIPSHLLKNPHNQSVLKIVRSHQRHMFTEGFRLKNDDGRRAIDKGYLAFDRYGYTVFVKIADVQVYF